jgi:sensor histidine kinase YesM
MESKIITQASKPFRINDLKARLIGIPFIALVMHIAFSKAQGQDIARLDGFFMAFLNTITYWEGLRLIWMNLQQKMPHYSQTKKRIIVLITSVLIYGILATVIIKYTEHFLLGNSCTIEEIINGYFLGLIPTTLVMIVYEAVYFFHSWKEKVIEAETLARTQLVSQLEALKSQLDPHFLFNSLNTLSSLIDENEPAQQYLSRLADVYRYVLLSKDKDTVTL